MHDTPSDITQKMSAMILEKSPTERVKMGCSMYETSKYLVVRAILKDNPQITPAALRKEFFLKFYGDDFDLIERNRILQHLEDTTPIFNQ